MSYPPILQEEVFEILVAEVKDWQITHGSLLKLVRTDEEHTVLSQTAGCTLFPSLFPAELFQEACALQQVYNRLYAAIAEDEQWLFETIKNLIDVDPFVNRLWDIYQEVKKEGFLQDITLGIYRSDYMLHMTDDTIKSLGLKQVEFNTVTCAGGVHGNKISDMHQHLNRIGIYKEHNLDARRPRTIQLGSSSLPRNRTLESITAGLATAHHAYGPATSTTTGKQTCVIIVVQPVNFNVADERPIEYALWDKSIPAFRVAFGNEVLSHTSLSPTGELIYAPPRNFISMEVSVVYFRSAFEVHELDETGYMARLRLEKSRAIKCPSLLSHLTGLKKVQQALTLPNVLERFLSPEESAFIARTFAPQYPLDDSELGRHAQKLALNPATATNHILKPSLEGGGHNVYGTDIPPFLNATPQEMWHQYILMERITPPLTNNMLMSPRGLYKGPVISELGIFGVCLWKRQVATDGKVRAEMLHELDPCWSFKTKDASVDEMSVVKGYGCFDSPALVTTETFLSSLDGP